MDRLKEITVAISDELVAARDAFLESLKRDLIEKLAHKGYTFKDENDFLEFCKFRLERYDILRQCTTKIYLLKLNGEKEFVTGYYYTVEKSDENFGLTYRHHIMEHDNIYGESCEKEKKY